MHERRRGQQADAAPLVVEVLHRGGHLGRGRGTGRFTTENVAAAVANRLRCGHITPLGMPVVPPV